MTRTKYNRVTPSIRKEIVELSLTGKSTYKIADAVKVSQGSVCRVLSKRKAVLNTMAKQREELTSTTRAEKAEVKVIKKTRRVPRILEPAPTAAVNNIVTVSYNGFKVHLDKSLVTDIYFSEEGIRVVTNK